MKLRLSEHCLRFRLGLSEVQRLGQGESLQQTLPLAPCSLTCRLEPGAENAATFDGALLGVCVAGQTARRWAQSDAVTLDLILPGLAGTPIQILIEKDFKCLHGETAGQEDCFPNPAAAVTAGSAAAK